MRPGDSNDMAPHFVELYVFSNRLRRAKQTVFRRSAQDAHRSRRSIVGSVEKPPFRYAQMPDFQIARLHAVNDRGVLLRLRKNLRRCEPLARCRVLNARHILPNNLVVAERQARRVFPDLLKFLAVARFLGFHNQVAHAQLLNERHHLLLRACADREHRHHRRHAENHSQHGQQGAQLMAGQVFQAKSKIRQPLFQGSRLSHRNRFHRRPTRFNLSSYPGWESRCRFLWASPSVFCPDSLARQLFRP